MINDHLQEDLLDLIHGFRNEQEKGAFVCMYCGAAFEEGLVYPVAAGSAQAVRAAADHVETAHGGAFAALLAKGNSGLPEVQEKVLRLLYEGKSDAEIAEALGGKSASTVRNHRFALRKREAEARTFLALIGLLDRRRPGTPRFVEYPAALSVKDERAMASQAEAEEIEARYLQVLPEGGIRLARWPKKQKEKLVLLRRIAELFRTDRRYAEKEVNAVLEKVWEDHVTIRRYLIEYRFLDRKSDGSEYWRP